MNKSSLSIILPVYNEKETLQQVLDEWKDYLVKNNISFTFLICEDGSTDGTKQILRTLKQSYPIILNQKKKRRGYGKAVLDGINSSTSEYILCVDSDGQCDPKDFLKFWKKRDSKDIIIGIRKLRSDTLLRKMYSAIFKFLFVILFGNSIKDPSAPYVLFKKKTILPHLHYLEYLQEGFWWGFSATIVKVGLSYNQTVIHHRLRLKGNTQVYKLSKIPHIAFRNSISLVKLRFAQ